MKLISAHLRNFRVHKDTKLSFPKKGVVGLVGSNESGKSSILEALTWALFAAKGVRGKVNGLRWRGATKRKVASVEWAIEVGGNTYRVKRTETMAEVHVGEDKPELVAHGQSGVTEYMEGVLGMSHAEFTASYLCEQKDVTRLATMAPMERQTFIRSIMGVSTLDAAVKTARTAMRDAQHEYDGFRSAMGDGPALEEQLREQEALEQQAGDARGEAESEHAESLRALNIAKIGWAQFTGLREHHAELVWKLEEAERQIPGMEDAVERAQQDHDEAEAARKVIAANEGIEDELKALRQEDKDWSQKELQVLALQNLRKGIGDRTDEMLEIEIRAQELKPAISGYNPHKHDHLREVFAMEREAHRKTRRKREVELAGAERVVMTAKAEITRLTESLGDGTCPTCRQELANRSELEKLIALAEERRKKYSNVLRRCQVPGTDEITRQDLRTKAQERLESYDRVQQDYRVAVAKRDSWNEQHATFDAQVTKMRAELKSVGPVLHDSVRHVEVVEEIEAKQKLVTKVEAARSVVDRFERRANDLERMTTRLSKQQEVVRQCKQDVENNPFDADEDGVAALRLMTAEKEEQRLRQRAQDARVAHAVAQGNLGRAQDALAAYEEQKERVYRMAGALQMKGKVADRLNEFRKSVLDTIRPEMEELVSGFLALLTDGRHESVEMSDSFGMELHEAGLTSPVVSGGTEDIAALALRLAISQQITERSGSPLSLLILDEPFGSLDEQRRGAVLNLLSMLSGVFPQVLLISHVSETRDAADHIIELEYDELRGHTKVL